MSYEILLKKLEKIEQLIQDQNLLKKEMLTLEEAARYLNLTKSTMYKMAHYNEIPYYCPNGKRTFFKRSELNRWLQKKRISCKQEMEAEAINNIINTRIK